MRPAQAIHAGCATLIRPTFSLRDDVTCVWERACPRRFCCCVKALRGQGRSYGWVFTL